MLGAASASPWHDLVWYVPSEQLAPTCDCGWSNRARIVDGKETGMNEYPFMVVLRQATNGEQFCGGTILTQWHVLTAAHCTDGKAPQSMVITAGAHNLKNWERNSAHHTLSAIVSHGNYDKTLITNDIAMLIVEQPFSFSRVIGPACLPRFRIDLQGQQVKGLGWGLTQDKGVLSDVLREVDLHVISMEKCQALWRMAGQPIFALPQEATNICTDHQTKDTCQGDSGGPKLWLNPNNNRYTLVGLISYGSDCGGPLPGVNTDVGAYLDWINYVIQTTKPGVTACSPP